jgi:hypothetical protein
MDRTIPDLTEYIQAHRVAYGPDHSGPEVGCAPRPSQALPDRRSRSVEAGGELAFGHARAGEPEFQIDPETEELT